MPLPSNSVSFCALRFARALTPVLLVVTSGGLVQAADGGWRTYEAGDVSFDAPASMQPPGVDQQTIPAANARNPAWTLTLTDRPDRPDRGATITFEWSRDVTEQATGAQVLARSQESVAYRRALRLQWRDASMGWRGVDTILREASPAGALFKVSCHSPEARWADTAQICNRIVASLSIVDGTDVNNDSAPQPEDRPAQAPANPPPMPAAANPPPPEPQKAQVKPAEPAQPVAAPTGGSSSFPMLGIAAIVGALVIGLGALLASRLRRAPAPLQAPAPVQKPAGLRATPCYCTECGTKVTHIGPCPNCGAAVEEDMPGKE